MVVHVVQHMDFALKGNLMLESKQTWYTKPATPENIRQNPSRGT